MRRMELGGRVATIWTLIAFVIVSSASLTTAQGLKPSSAKEEEPRLESVRALKDPFLPGQVRTYYTPGFKKRAKAVQDFLTDERAFHSKELGIHLDLTVAVLNAKQWEQLNIVDPYGVPTVTDYPPYVALLPADWSENHLGMLPPENETDPALVKQVKTAGAGLIRLSITDSMPSLGTSSGMPPPGLTGSNRPHTGSMSSWPPTLKLPSYAIGAPSSSSPYRLSLP